MSKQKNQKHLEDYLIHGSDYLAGKPDFELVGRDSDLKKLSKALTRESASSVLLVGPGGVGCSALAVGLQASKDDPDAPLDIIGKRMFWLDTDGLFSSGDPSTINDAFQRAISTLSANPDTVLVIDDMRDFVDAARSNGCPNLINALMREIKAKRFQAVLESDDDDLEVVLKCHSDMKEGFTLLDIQPPQGEELEKIVAQAAKRLEKHHKIKISEEAIKAAIELTTKYRVRDLGLSRAQPEAAVTLLDRSLTSYRLDAHSEAPGLAELQERLKAVTAVLEDPNYSADQGGKTIEELETEKAALETDITEVEQEWSQRREKILSAYKEIRQAENFIKEREDKIVEIKNAEIEAREALQKQSGHDSDANLNDVGESNQVVALRREIAAGRKQLDQGKGKFEQLTADINEGLELDKESVYEEFSSISGVPVSKLTQNEKAKLFNLEKNLKGRVWGQDNAVERLADDVLSAKAGLQDPDKPQTAFLYLGPSGVGKTELAKALSSEVLDDEKALLRFDMSEYQEKHALAKLIGAPPGYEGYEAGGILTNEMRRNPRRIILFDEIEKAHPDIFLVFLQILDDARLTDNRGLTVSFRDSIIIMTSNAGKKHFIDPNLSFDEASELAMEQLGDVDNGGLPPELLNRFNGRENIVCFKALSLDVIEKIANRELKKLNQKIQRSKPGLSISMSPDELHQMCEDKYEPVHGARGIQGFIGSNIKKAVAKTVLFDDNAEGVMEVEYDSEKGVTVHPAKLITPEQPELVRPSEEAVAKFGGTQPG